MNIEVSLGLWQDRPAAEVLDTARIADELGYPAVWIGEMATYDAFALATAAGAAMRTSSLVLGPFAVQVRDPMMIAMGAASVAALTGRPVQVALGTSSTVVVEEWHGRARSAPGAALEEAAEAVAPILAGGKSGFTGRQVGSRGYRLRLAAPGADLTIAAFGPRAIATAARHAARMVVNLVDPTTAGELAEALGEAANRIGRERPRVAAWIPTCVDPDAAAVDQIRRGVVGYLAAPGYSDMFERAGFAQVVEFARSRPHPRELLAAIPDELVFAVTAFGDRDAVLARLRAYEAAGVDDLVIVPACTDADPAAAHTLKTLAPGAGF
ncbi:LLM class F420-dependent oxidoreductase [Actinocorallia longicatena]|uniref:LLM class F420-dependent oxidoreductase n=1 Tax=Actinocorallia longicatena TaxID=111803 RepID=A0ABP6QCM3_9ACTN